jgi:uncharacterized protein (DUF2384 family)
MASYRGREEHNFKVVFESSSRTWRGETVWAEAFHPFVKEEPSRRELARMQGLAERMPHKVRNVRLVAERGSVPVYY